MTRALPELKKSNAMAKALIAKKSSLILAKLAGLKKIGIVEKNINSKKVLAGRTFKAKVGFEAKINIITKAKVKVDKFSTAGRNTNSNIEGLNINNSAADLIALIIKLAKYVNLIVLIFILKRPGRILVVANFFSYLSISF